jgi:hypothetical protein
MAEEESNEILTPVTRGSGVDGGVLVKSVDDDEDDDDEGDGSDVAVSMTSSSTRVPKRKVTPRFTKPWRISLRIVTLKNKSQIIEKKL